MCKTENSVSAAGAGGQGGAFSDGPAWRRFDGVAEIKVPTNIGRAQSSMFSQKNSCPSGRLKLSSWPYGPPNVMKPPEQPWRTHSCVQLRDSPGTSAQTIGNKEAAAPRFLAPETFPAGIVPRSSRCPRRSRRPACRGEARHGTQECVRHGKPGFDRAFQD